MSHPNITSVPATACPENANPEQRRRHWQAHLARWQDSGLSQSAYCRERNLVLHQFVYWRKRLEDRPAEGSYQTDESPSSGGFVPLRLARPLDRPAVPVAKSLSLHVPGGLTITGITAGNLDLVVQLVDAL